MVTLSEWCMFRPLNKMVELPWFRVIEDWNNYPHNYCIVISKIERIIPLKGRNFCGLTVWYIFSILLLPLIWSIWKLRISKIFKLCKEIELFIDFSKTKEILKNIMTKKRYTGNAMWIYCINMLGTLSKINVLITFFCQGKRCR